MKWDDKPCNIGRTRQSRKAWIRSFGEIPDGLCVLHYCDEKHCIEPSHLWLGTYAQNTEDMDRKGRRGYSNKLTKDQWEEVFKRREAGEGRSPLAKEFGIHPMSISNMMRWKGRNVTERRV